MPPIFIFVLMICAVGVIAFLSYYFSSKNVIIRILKNLPLDQSSTLKNNQLSKVSGKALHVTDPLIAPFSKRKCIFYQLKIEQKVNSGKNSRWKTLVAEERFQDFFINVNGEVIIIKPLQHPKNYICHLVKDSEQSSGTFNDPTSEFNQLLKRYNIESENFFGFNKTLRYEEGIIEIGELITVAGIAKWKSLKEPMPDYPYSKIVALESDAKQKLIITDLPEVANSKR